MQILVSSAVILQCFELNVRANMLTVTPCMLVGDFSGDTAAILALSQCCSSFIWWRQRRKHGFTSQLIDTWLIAPLAAFSPCKTSYLNPNHDSFFPHSVIQRLSRVMEIWKEILQFSLTEHEHTSRLPDIPWLVLVVRLKITEIYYYHNCYKCLRACLLLDAQTVKGFSEHCCLMGLCEKNAIGPQAFFKSA